MMPFSKPDWSTREVCISLWAALSFIGLGTSLNIIGPTLLDIAAYNRVGLAEVAAMMFVRSIGSIIGSVGSGIFCDRYQQYSLWMLISGIIFGSSLTAVLPLSNHLAILGVLMFCHGIALGGLDNGVHALLFVVWKNKDAGPVMQLIHFAFAFGAFLSPLIARPFISDETDTIQNVTCENFTVPDNCIINMQENCTSYIDGSGSGGSYDCANTVSILFRYAYWIVSVPLLLSLPGLLVYAIKEQCCCWSKDKLKMNNTENESSGVKSEKTYPSTIPYLFSLMSLLFLLMFTYVGLEVTYGTYIFTYGVKQHLFSKPEATILTSVFWGTFAFFRFFSISLSLLKVPPSLMLAGNLTGSLLASIIIVIWPTNKPALWVGSALMGVSFASIYPNIVVWLTRHGPATGRATSVLSSGAVLGDMSLPVLVGVLIDKVGPVSLIYFTLAAVLLAVCITIVLFSIARLCRVKPAAKINGSAKYERLQFEEEELSTIDDERVEGDGKYINDHELESQI